jgi:predicted transcriptional regulator
MDINPLILSTIKKNGKVTTADIVSKTGLSRAYTQRFLKNLADNGVIFLVGKANQAHYILAAKKGIISSKPLSIHKILTNKDLAEDKVLREAKIDSSIFHGLGGNLSSIIDYAFTEMLNNAI